MSCLKVANNETNNYRTCQSLFDFIKLTIFPTEKKPIRKMSKSSNIINKSSILKKKVNCSNCVQKLNVRDIGHRANSKDCLLNNENWINKHWNQRQLQLSNEFGSIYKINDLNKNKLKKFRNDLICFYSVNISEITKVSNLFIFIL